MSVKEIKVCDGCGTELTKISDCYKLHLETDKFWVVDGYEDALIDLDFCFQCSKEIKQTLIDIAKKKPK